MVRRWAVPPAGAVARGSTLHLDPNSLKLPTNALTILTAQTVVIAVLAELTLCGLARNPVELSTEPVGGPTATSVQILRWTSI